MFKIMDDSMVIEGLTDKIIEILEDITNLYEYDVFVYHEFSVVLYDHSGENVSHDQLGYYVDMIIDIRENWLQEEKDNASVENIDDILDVHEEIILLNELSRVLNK